MPDRIDSLLGFAAKARKLAVGTNTCIFRMQKREIALLLLASDLAEGTVKKMTSAAQKAGVPCRTYGTIEKLSHVTGNPGAGVFGVTDRGFAESILKETDKETPAESSEREVFGCR